MKTPSQLRGWAGLGVWCVWLFTRVPGVYHAEWAYALLLLVALVLGPSVLLLALDRRHETPDADRLMRWVLRLEFPAALLLAASFARAPGGVAALFALPWVLMTLLSALAGILRVLRGSWRATADLCRDAGLIFLAIGGAWVLADRAAWAVLGFDPTIVALTAVHFHFAGFILPVVAGLVIRALPSWRTARLCGFGVLLGVPAVAVGITSTQFHGPRVAEALAAWLLAAAAGGVGGLQAVVACQRRWPLAVRVVWLISGFSLLGGMTLAALYAARVFGVASPWLEIPAMRVLHGTLNALGFGAAAVAGWRAAVRTR
jgi:hypothetical protein